MQYLNIDSMMMVFHESNKRHMQNALKRARKFHESFAPVRISRFDHWSLDQVKMLKLHFKHNPIRPIPRNRGKKWYERVGYDALKDKR